MEDVSAKSTEEKQKNEAARWRLQPPPESVWEGRIMSHIIALNKLDDNEFKEHIIPFSAIEQYLDHELTGKDYTAIKKAVLRLLSMALVIPYDKRELGGIPLFKFIKLDDSGNILACMNDSLRRFFLQCDNFTLYFLSQYNALSSIYSQDIFRFLIFNKNLGCGYFDMPLEELHVFLGTPPSFRSDFSAMRVRVLDVAHREINEKTDLRFEWEGLTRPGYGKKIHTIRFTFPEADRD